MRVDMNKLVQQELASHKPFYNGENPSNATFRVVYKQNNLWACQKRTAPKGTREQDCWQDTHRPTSDKQEALRQMRTLVKLQSKG